MKGIDKLWASRVDELLVLSFVTVLSVSFPRGGGFTCELHLCLSCCQRWAASLLRGVVIPRGSTPGASAGSPASVSSTAPTNPKGVKGARNSKMYGNIMKSSKNNEGS